MSFAGGREEPLTGQILLSLVHPTSHPEPLSRAPGAERWGWGLDQGPGQKGSAVEGGCSGERDLRQSLLASLAGQKSRPSPRRVFQRGQVREGEEAEERNKG